MKSLILNSGLGSRMGQMTIDKHKSMVEIANGLPLIIYQIQTMASAGITDFIITTGYMHDKLTSMITQHFNNKYNFEFVYNNEYKTTNYIYSIYLALNKLNDDLLILHGDLYFKKETLINILAVKQSSVAVDTTLPQPEKDFKARIVNNKIMQIATYIHDSNCIACQPLYKLNKADWQVWAESICKFCNEGNKTVYAEEALNCILDRIYMYPYDLKGALCMEIDTIEDLAILTRRIGG